MAKIAAYRYSGLLNRPMPKPERMNALNPNSPIDRARMAQEYKCRLDALTLNCGVDPSDPDCWLSVALALAERHVPGFSFESFDTTTRRLTRSQRDMRVYVAMIRLIDAGMSQRSAADVVAKKLNRKRGGGKNIAPDAINSLYRRLKREAGGPT